MENIYLYKIIDVSEIMLYKDNLAMFLFELPVNKKKYVFNISPISGWIYYSNFEEIRNNSKLFEIPQTEKDVIKYLKLYLKKVSDNFVRNPKFKDINPFPDYLNIEKPAELLPVINSQTESIDHWLCRYNVSILAKDELVPLIGSTVEFRVGNKGKIIGCSIKYRKIIGQISSTKIEYEIDKESHSHANHTDEDTGEETEKVVLCYKLGGETEHQNFLVPFYLKADGHHYSFVPASEKSLTLGIYEVHSDSGVELYSNIEGGSGNYSYEWSSWNIEDWDSSFNDLGNLNYCKLGIGVHNVILTIIDKGDFNNEVIFQTQQTIYANGESNEINNIDNKNVIV